MSTEILPFRRDGLDIRVMLIDGEPWWVASDIAHALGYSATSAMLRSLDEDDKGVQDMHTPGGFQALSIISEGGMYSAILRSPLPEAREFKRWITHEVIPSIRKTGGYGQIERALPSTFAEALRELASEVESHEETKAALAAAEPRAAAWNAIASAEGDYSVADAAKMLVRAGIPTGPTRLFAQLAEIRWTFRGPGGKWRGYADRVEKGYLAERPMQHYHPKTGELVLDPPQLRVTLKGIERLRQRLHVGALGVAS